MRTEARILFALLSASCSAPSPPVQLGTDSSIQSTVSQFLDLLWSEESKTGIAQTMFVDAEFAIVRTDEYCSVVRRDKNSKWRVDVLAKLPTGMALDSMTGFTTYVDESLLMHACETYADAIRANDVTRTPSSLSSDSPLVPGTTACFRTRLENRDAVALTLDPRWGGTSLVIESVKPIKVERRIVFALVSTIILRGREPNDNAPRIEDIVSRTAQALVVFRADDGKTWKVHSVFDTKASWKGTF